MMKILIFNGKQFQAEKIIKNETDIIGQNSNGIEVFSFKGISDFTRFTLEEGQTFDVEENLQETTAKEVASLKLGMMKKDTIITGALKSIADLKVEIMSLKGGNA